MEHVGQRLATKLRACWAIGRAYCWRGPAPRIYAVGDSHSTSMLHCDNVHVLHLGPVTAYRAGRPGEVRRLFATRALGRVGSLAPKLAVRLIVRPCDVVLLFFGEIDVRAHFSSQWERYGTANELARFLAQRLATEASALGAGIVGLTPPADVNDPDLPTRGTAHERLEWTLIFNSELKLAASQLGLVYVDSYSAFADAMGMLDSSISDGSVHIARDKSAPLFAAVRHLVATADSRPDS